MVSLTVIVTIILITVTVVMMDQIFRGPQKKKINDNIIAYQSWPCGTRFFATAWIFRLYSALLFLSILVCSTRQSLFRNSHTLLILVVRLHATVTSDWLIFPTHPIRTVVGVCPDNVHRKRKCERNTQRRHTSHERWSLWVHD